GWWPFGSWRRRPSSWPTTPPRRSPPPRPRLRPKPRPRPRPELKRGVLVAGAHLPQAAHRQLDERLLQHPPRVAGHDPPFQQPRQPRNQDGRGRDRLLVGGAELLLGHPAVEPPDPAGPPRPPFLQP